MIASQKTLICEFVEHERRREIRSLRKIPYLIKVFFAYLDQRGIDLAELSTNDAQEYQTYISTMADEEGNVHYASSTVFDLVYTAKCLYAYLKDRGEIHSNPFTGIKLIKVRSKLPRNIPREEAMHEFLEVLRCFWKEKLIRYRRSLYKAHVIAELMYSTGLRLSEAAHLEEEDIDFEAGVVHVRNGKGGKDRTAYLNDYAARVLHIYLQEMREVVNVKGRSKKIFGVKNGRNLDPALNKVLKSVGEQCGIGRFTSHSFRHTLGFHLLRRGCDMRYIQLILGHDDMNSTTLYTRVEKSDLKRELDNCHPRRFTRMKKNP